MGRGDRPGGGSRAVPGSSRWPAVQPPPPRRLRNRRHRGGGAGVRIPGQRRALPAGAGLRPAPRRGARRQGRGRWVVRLPPDRPEHGPSRLGPARVHRTARIIAVCARGVRRPRPCSRGARRVRGDPRAAGSGLPGARSRRGTTAPRHRPPSGRPGLAARAPATGRGSGRRRLRRPGAFHPNVQGSIRHDPRPLREALRPPAAATAQPVRSPVPGAGSTCRSAGT